MERIGPREFVRPSPPTGGKRYAGTADAVLQNLERHQCRVRARSRRGSRATGWIIATYLSFHVASRADATIATVDRPRGSQPQTGVLVRLDDSNHVVGFKPSDSGEKDEW